MSEPQIYDQLRLMLIAGHDTTASTIAWAIERITHTHTVGADRGRAHGP